MRWRRGVEPRRAAACALRRGLPVWLLVALTPVALALVAGGCRRAADASAARADTRDLRQDLPRDPPGPPQIRAALLPAEQPRQEPRAPAEDDWFEDLTAGSGVDFAYEDGSNGRYYTLLETVGGGASLIDFDSDGDLDLFITGGGTITGPPITISGKPCALFRNDGDWQFADVTQAMGLAADDLYTHGSTVADFDRDGHPDLVVAGFGGCRLYRNEGGKRFVDVSQAAGLTRRAWFTTAAAGDFDKDGWPDLYLVTYCQWEPDEERLCAEELTSGLVRDTCAPTMFPGDRDQLLRNLGDGRFEDVTDRAQLTSENRGLGIICTDVDEDGFLDFFVASDVHANDLYFGTAELPLESTGVYSGVAFSPEGSKEGSMGVDTGDVDGDGRVDLFYTNFSKQDNALFLNSQQRGFSNQSTAYGLSAISRRWVSFGTGLVDFNSDNWPDIFVLNGHVRYEAPDGPYFQPTQLLFNDGGRRYVDQSARGGPYFSVPHAGRGGAVGDLDNDGGLDLVLVHQNDPVVLLRNRYPAENWVRVRLRGTRGDADAIGAKVSAEIGGRTVTHWVRGGGGFCSTFDPRILFSLVDDAPLEVTVRWLGGSVEIFSGLKRGATHELVEGTGRKP